MKYEGLRFIVNRTDSTVFGAGNAKPTMVEVGAMCCGSELTFDAPTDSAPRIGDVVTVTVEWGEDE